MIFVTTGSRSFPFERLIKAVDATALALGLSKQEVFAQIGTSGYEPEHVSFDRFLDKTHFDEKIRSCDILITHAAAGAMLSGLHMKKKIIAIPRLLKYGEIIDNHQAELASVLAEQNWLFYLEELSLLPEKIKEIENHTFDAYTCRPDLTVDRIRTLIEGVV